MTRALDDEQLRTLRELCQRAHRTRPREEPTMNDTTPITLAVVSAGVSDPSSTRLLADRIAQKTVDTLRAITGTSATVSVIDLGPIAVDIARSLVSGFPNEAVQEAIDRLAKADAIIAATPV